MGSCKKLRIDGYAHHAYTRKAGPDVRLRRTTDDVSIGSLGRLTAALDKAARGGRIASHRPIYLTEFGIQSRPDKLGGVPLARQAEYLAIVGADRLRQPAREGVLPVPAARRQAAHGAAGQRYSGFETGLRTSKGKKKPAYNAFMLPLAATRYGSQDVLWGRVRPATGPTEVMIEHKIGKGRGGG